MALLPVSPRSSLASATHPDNEHTTTCGALTSEQQAAVQAARATLNLLKAKDLGVCKTMRTPPAGVDDVFAAVMLLLCGVKGSAIAVPVDTAGKVRDRRWDTTKKVLLGNVRLLHDELKALPEAIVAGDVQASNFEEVRKYCAFAHFTPDIIAGKNAAAARLCQFVKDALALFDALVPPATLAERLDAAERVRAALEAELSVARPAVEAAAAALDTLKAQDITEIKAYTKPPELVKKTLMAVQIVLGEREPTWERAKRMLGSATFLGDLKNYPKDELSDGAVDRVAALALEPVDQLACVSRAAAGLGAWVHALVTYHEAARAVAPKAAQLRRARAEITRLESRARVEAELDAAQPAMEAAAAAVNCLSKSMLTELKSLPKPPKGVDMVTSACLVLVEHEYKNYKWDRAKKMMANVDKFKKRLEDLRGEDITEKDIKRIEVYINNPEFTVENMQAKSAAAANLCTWVVNIYNFNRIYVKVKPLLDALEAPQENNATADATLAKADAAPADDMVSPTERAYRATRNALAQSVTKADLLELRRLHTPQPLVHEIIRLALALLADVPRAPQLDGADDWAACRRALYDARLLPAMAAFGERFEAGDVQVSNFDAVSATRLAAITDERARAVSHAAAGVAAWVRAASAMRTAARDRVTEPARKVLVRDISPALRELKALSKPPAGVDAVVNALGALLGVERLFADGASGVPALARDMAAFAARAEAGEVTCARVERARELLRIVSPAQLKFKSCSAAAVGEWAHAAIAFAEAYALPPPPQDEFGAPSPPPAGDDVQSEASWSEVASEASWSQLDADERDHAIDSFGDSLAFEPICEPKPTVSPPPRWPGVPEARALGGDDAAKREAAFAFAAKSAPPPPADARSVADVLARGEPLALREVRQHAAELTVLHARVDGATGELAELDVLAPTALLIVHATADEVLAYKAGLKARRTNASDAPSDERLHALLRAAIDAAKVGHVDAVPCPPWARDGPTHGLSDAATPPATPPVTPPRPKIDLSSPWSPASFDNDSYAAEKPLAANVAGSPVSVVATLADVCVGFEPHACDAADVRAIRMCASRAARVHDGTSSDAPITLIDTSTLDALCAVRRADSTVLDTVVAPGNGAWAHIGEWVAGAPVFEQDRDAAARTAAEVDAAFHASLRTNCDGKHAARELGFALLPAEAPWTPIASLGVADDIGGAETNELARGEQKRRVARVAARVAAHLRKNDDDAACRAEAAFLRRRLLWFADAMRRSQAALDVLCADNGINAAPPPPLPACPPEPVKEARIAECEAKALRAAERRARVLGKRDVFITRIETRYAAHLAKTAGDAAEKEAIARTLAAHRTAFDAACAAAAAIEIVRDVPPPPSTVHLAPDAYAAKLAEDAANACAWAQPSFARLITA